MPSRVVIGVSGSNFRWRFRYFGRDLQPNTADDIVSDEVLRVPEGTEVELHLTSEDYIYRLVMPPQNHIQIAVPGLTFVSRFLAVEQATYDLPSDPLCNPWADHQEPMGRVIVQPRSTFVAWFDSESKKTSPR